jgi:hypothetical protein
MRQNAAAQKNSRISKNKPAGNREKMKKPPLYRKAAGPYCYRFYPAAYVIGLPADDKAILSIMIKNLRQISRRLTLQRNSVFENRDFPKSHKLRPSLPPGSNR